MTYNAKIHNEQGGSVLTVQSAGSIAVAAGGTISGAGTISLTGGATFAGAITTTSLTIDQPGENEGPVQFGTFVQIMFSAASVSPSDTPLTASPGAVYFRSDGANSAGYVNTGDDLASSSWTIFSELGVG